MTVSGVVRPEKWAFPPYALDMLWLTTASGEASALQLDGSFSLENVTYPVSALQLRWGNARGSVLTIWETNTTQTPLQLKWDGKTTIGGFVERTHILEFNDMPMMVVEIVGGVYPRSFMMLPSLEQLQMTDAFTRDQQPDPSEEENWYSVLLPLESPFVDFVHHALVNGSAIDAYAHLANDDDNWHQLTGMPLILEQLTLLSTSF